MPADLTRRAVLGGGLRTGAFGAGLRGTALGAGLLLPGRAAGALTRIEIDGPRLLYGGAPLRLTGVAVGDPHYIRADRRRSDYARIATDWLANCVRISMMPAYWRADPAEAWARLRREVGAARGLGLFVIIDWHRIGWPGRYDPLAPPEWGAPADLHLATLDETRAFWRVAATAYADDPAVLFELWNEPSVDPLHWENTGRDWPLFKEAWTRIIADIRMRADNICLCAGGNWAHDLVGVRDDLLDDARTAYVWHAYPNASRDDTGARLGALGGLHEVRPVIVTEWGWTTHGPVELRADEASYGAPMLDAFDRLNLHHTAWCYSPGAEPRLLGPERGALTEFGAFARARLRRASLNPAWRTT